MKDSYIETLRQYTLRLLELQDVWKITTLCNNLMQTNEDSKMDKINILKTVALPLLKLSKNEAIVSAIYISNTLDES